MYKYVANGHWDLKRPNISESSEQKSSLGEGVCLHLTLAEILAETAWARLTSLARVKLA